jgi:hypothetical protein
VVQRLQFNVNQFNLRPTWINSTWEMMSKPVNSTQCRGQVDGIELIASLHDDAHEQDYLVRQ